MRFTKRKDQKKFLNGRWPNPFKSQEKKENWNRLQVNYITLSIGIIIGIIIHQYSMTRFLVCALFD